ncbi:MAG TPA: YwiC-like family protein [Polyangia bacterium]|jgi:hypothetical protein
MRSLSIPHEHGAYLTIAGAAVAGAWVAPSPLASIGVAIALAAGFFARGPIETRAPKRWDRLALAIYALGIAGGAALAGWARPRLALAALAMAAIPPAAAFAARRMRRLRGLGFELLGMGALGASAGPIALAGSAPYKLSALLALVIGVHAALAVPLVRTELRRRERPRASRIENWAMGALAATASLTIFVGPARLALALAPRALHLAARRTGGLGTRPASWVGARETVALAFAVVFAVVAR